MEFSLFSVIWTSLLVFLGLGAYRIIYNVFWHPLSSYPGPQAAKATAWWKTYIEVVKQESMVDVLFDLHKRYGDIIRIGPNELHFAKPSAYNDIYSSSARWEKERTLYESFGEDHTSFGFLTYSQSKQRKDVLKPLFSRRAVHDIQGLVRNNADRLVKVLAKNNSDGKSSDMLFAFRCFAVDNITEFCFSKSVNAIDAPDFAAPIVEAMDNSLPTFHLFKNFPLFRKIIFSLPPWLAIKASPETAGLTRLQVILGEQVRELIARPEALKDTPHQTIYHRLLDPEAQNGHPVPDFTNLYEEAQMMMFAGGVTVGDTLMTGLFHVLSQPELYHNLVDEVRNAWPDIKNAPSYEEFEKLSLLTATIKEMLRLSPGACSPLLRVVPANGATISGNKIPGGTIVGMSAVLVHRASSIFEEPEKFSVERWLDNESKVLDQWICTFSKGPRSCLGINLAWCELYVALATMLRCFEMALDGTTNEDMVWRDCFTPYYYRRHLRVWCKPLLE